MWEPTNGVDFCGINIKILIRSSNLEIMSYGTLKEKKHIWANSRKDGLVHSWYNRACFNEQVDPISISNH